MLSTKSHLWPIDVIGPDQKFYGQLIGDSLVSLRINKYFDAIF